MPTSWFIAKDAQESGPIPFKELVEMVRRGELTGDDRVRGEWLKAWQRADAVPGLMYMARQAVRAATELQATEHIGGDLRHDQAAGSESRADSIGAHAPERPSWMARYIHHGLPYGQVRSAGRIGAADPTQVSDLSDQSCCNSGELSNGEHLDGKWSHTIKAACEAVESRCHDPGSAHRPGRAASVFRGVAAVVALIVSPNVLRQCFRWGSALTAAVLTGWWVLSWSAQEAQRFPSLRSTAVYQFPFCGQCARLEYFVLLADIALVMGVAAYCAATWVERRAD